MKRHSSFIVGLVATASVACTMFVVAGAITAPTAQAAGTRFVDMIFPSATVTSSVTYATVPALVTGAPTNLKLDIYQPAGDTSAARPVLIAIHGGGFRVGAKVSVGDWATEWARRGYVVVGIDYRLDAGNKCQDIQDGQVPPPDIAAETARCTAAIVAAQNDAQAAVRWIRAHATTYGVDPTRIAAIGSSAGAVTAVHMAQRSESPGDIGDYDGYDSRIGAALAMSGCNYDLASIGAGDAPVSMIHAEHDGAVPMQCAIDTAATAHANGLVADTMFWYGEGTHAIDLYRKYQTTIDPVWTQFLIRYLNLGNQLAPGSMVQIHGTPNRSAVVSVLATQTGGAGYLQALPCSAATGNTSNLNSDAAGQTRAGLAVVHFDGSGTACVYNSMTTHVVVDLQGYLDASAFEDFTDTRLLDTRSGVRPAAGSMVVLHGQPNRSAVLSIVATGSAGWGYVQALPCGITPGSTSNLNLDGSGQTRAGLAIVPFGADGTACVYTSVATHLVVDLQGYLVAGTFDDVADTRLLDTRSGARAGAGSTTVIHGRADSSAFISLIATLNVGGGYVAATPCGTTPGTTSNLNVDAGGQTIASAAVVHFDATGEACVYTSVVTHLIVDLQGYFQPGSFDDVADVRLLDTRQPS